MGQPRHNCASQDNLVARRSVPTGGNGKPSKNYGYLNHLDATGWYEEFYRIWNEFDVLKYPNAPKFRNIKAWSENGVRHHVRIIEKTIEVKTGVNTGLLVNRYRLPALVVYLDAPDKTIVKAVEK